VLMWFSYQHHSIFRNDVKPSFLPVAYHNLCQKRKRGTTYKNNPKIKKGGTP
jgi:hypothetical protein